MDLIIFLLVIVILMFILSIKIACGVVDYAEDIRDGAKRQKKIERLLEEKATSVYNDNRQIHLHTENKDLVRRK